MKYWSWPFTVPEVSWFLIAFISQRGIGAGLILRRYMELVRIWYRTSLIFRIAYARFRKSLIAVR